ncbi:uncharacterized protein LOC143363312 [Halictus rubicundus]|uniref:uncharacterized protein LOC143363312 n=1 Tax=Halictus rubicundus TaxID=77578 RepID=UPI004035FA18
MAELIATQETLKRAIERSLSNLKKLGKTNWTVAGIHTRMNHLKTQWATFEANDVKISAAIPPEDRPSMAYFKDNYLETTEETFLQTLTFMNSALADLTPKEVSHTASTDTPGAFAPPVAHLPPIPLQPFDGRCEEWEAFRDRFQSLIIANSSLNNFSRMHYLVSSLAGRALGCISNLSVTQDNFAIAWKTLTSRYDNPRRLLAKYLTTLLDLHALNRESASDLQNLRDRLAMTVSSLRNLGRSAAELWDDFLLHLAVQKLDPATRKAWTLRAGDDTKFPSFEEFQTFIDTRVRALEDFDSGASGKIGASSSLSASRPSRNPAHSHLATASKNSQGACPLCKAHHYLGYCSSFLAKSPRQRLEIVKRLSCCPNCLSYNHAISSCASKHTCRMCQKRHHSLLHDESTPGARSSAESSGTRESVSAEINSHSATAGSAATGSSILLATARIQVSVPSGRSVIIRALIDQGSEASFVAESVVQLLRAKRNRVVASISAVGGVHAGTVRHATHLLVSNRTSSAPCVPTTALVLGSMSTYKPSRVRNWRTLAHLADLSWADHDPSSSDPIQMILGADVYPSIIQHGLRKGQTAQPIAQNTIFGWVISGPLHNSLDRGFFRRSEPVSNTTQLVSTHHCVHDNSLDADLRRFWEIEEIPHASLLTPAEKQCEQYFRDSTTRTTNGRYIVRLPFRSNPPLRIGHSRSTAERIMLHLNRRFESNPNLASEYRDFMQEYERLGHMRSAVSSSSDSQSVYIPHHPVLREGSSTTHLRVVFNASSVTTNGSSLNDHLLPGPKLQTNLSSVILRWRAFRFVYTADIAKMYRQILVDPRDVSYQRILWAPHSADSIQEYELLTVTYGMTCAPYLALRVLQRLVEDEGDRFLLASPILRSNTYIDDLLFGHDDIASLRHCRDQLIKLLHCGKFHLRKWASNHPSLLSDIDPSDHGLACTKDLAQDDQVKVLGICWNPSQDTFQFKTSLSDSCPSTKRSILSTIAKIYDPLGWITPATILAKVFIQELWRLRVGWDEPIPVHKLSKWRTLYSQLAHLDKVQLPRWIGLISTTSRVELHGFSDASTVAYSAVVYAKCISSSGEITISFLAGKSKVAPLNPLTIPRLELQGACLMIRLIEFVLESFDSRPIPCVCWTDSTVVLNWISQHPSRWKTFVANRVATIQTRLPQAEWRHVPTECNPADCASRGLLSDDLLGSDLWWHGPSWLRRERSEWPNRPLLVTDDVQPEAKVVSAHVVTTFPRWDLESRFSSWPKLIRVTAYMFRFLQACRKGPSAPRPSPVGRALTAAECNSAKLWWLKYLQSTLFPVELDALRRKRYLSRNCSILSLDPFLDSDGLLRVGGRLHRAPLPFNSKHPIILSSHPLVRLIIEQAHLRSLHGGLQLTLSTLRQTFWILRARSLVKAAIHSCVVCVRERAAVPEQLMGRLPESRVSPQTKCFSHCGVDYAGPIQVRASAGRGITSRKAYISLFVCLATKAIHLELVSDYSTRAFLNAYVRFCARRGIPSAIYSDNGTTFVGASRELTRAFRESLTNPEFLNKAASDGVTWHFIPPSAPHFGGLWEAGVKSLKHHLKRVVGPRTFTFEEFSTLLCSIEACLNSRPIAPLRDSVDDFDVLTPGHFLIGSALSVPPQPSLLEISENRLARWQLVRHTTERFWKIWMSDYLNTLQQRSKWRREQPPLRTGQLVLLRNSNLPPCKWELGRIKQLHPGDDGHVRVVTVKTSSTELMRPIVKLCPLPIDSASPSM